MDEKGYSSMSLRKALNQNQSIDRELQKDLHILDLKKKTSEKALIHKQTQFLRKRLRMSRNSPVNYSPQGERKLWNGLQDIGSSQLSTGDLLDYFKNPSRSPSPLLRRRQFGNQPNMHKLSLDSYHRYCNYSKYNKTDEEKKKRSVRFASGKTMEKSHSWSNDLYVKDDGHHFTDGSNGFHGISQISGNNLKVPSMSKKYTSRSDETLHDNEDKHDELRKTQSDEYLSETLEPNNHHNYSNSLTVPLLDKRLSRSEETLSSNAQHPSEAMSCKMPAIEQQHFFHGKMLHRIRPATSVKASKVDGSQNLQVPEVHIQRKHSLNDSLLAHRRDKVLSSDANPPATTRANYQRKHSNSNELTVATQNRSDHDSVKPHQNQRKHSQSRELTRKPRKSQKEQATDNQLSLPVLSRQRSKSCEDVFMVEHDELRARSHSGSDAISPSNQSISLPRQPMPPASPRSTRRKLSHDPRKVSSFGEETEKDRKLSKKESKLHRSSSTPDLSDLGQEVEYLLMDDDKTRLQRIRASVDSLRSNGNIEDCRYIRNVHTHPQSSTNEQATASDDLKLPTINQNTQLNIGDESSHNDHQQHVEPVVSPGDEDENKEVTSQTRDDDEAPIKELEESLGSSSSTLAEMFEEIKNTRYLRMPGSPARRKDGDADVDDEDDDDDDIDVCMMSHGYNTPLIIVGHTKAVLLDGNTFDS